MQEHDWTSFHGGRRPYPPLGILGHRGVVHKVADECAFAVTPAYDNAVECRQRLGCSQEIATPVIVDGLKVERRLQRFASVWPQLLPVLGAEFFLVDVVVCVVAVSVG